MARLQWKCNPQSKIYNLFFTFYHLGFLFLDAWFNEQIVYFCVIDHLNRLKITPTKLLMIHFEWSTLRLYQRKIQSQCPIRKWSKNYSALNKKIILKSWSTSTLYSCASKGSPRFLNNQYYVSTFSKHRVGPCYAHLRISHCRLLFVSFSYLMKRQSLKIREKKPGSMNRRSVSPIRWVYSLNVLQL